mmetsp:Transcript_5361/g.15750  ORF Transcript_5361/g.15750 Transcript_5361/m.15750 type:complete len:292 (-) Transcript_5361:950-1825(-)
MQILVLSVLPLLLLIIRFDSGENLCDLLAFGLQLQVRSRSNLQRGLDDVLGSQLLGSFPRLVGCTAQRSDGLGREAGVVRLVLRLGQLVDEGGHELLLGGVVGMVQQAVADAGGGFGSGPWLAVDLFRLAVLPFLVLDAVEGVGEDGKGEVVEAGNVLLGLGMGSVIESLPFTDATKLDEGDDGLADFPKGGVVEDEGAFLLALVVGGAPEKDDVACQKGSVGASLVRVSQQAETLQTQTTGIHAVLHEQSVCDFKRDDGIFFVVGCILLLHREHSLDLVGVDEIQVRPVG